MNEHEPDFIPAHDRHVGTASSSLPVPNQGEPELVITADPEAAAALAADRIVAGLIAAVEVRGRADFCTTGGSTPIPIYRLLSRSPLCDRIPWRQVHFWFGDDRFVPRDHPDSNVASLDDVLLGGAAAGEPGGSAPLPTANIHVMPMDKAIAGLHDTAWCAARYADEMAVQLPLGDGNWPRFDLILIGVGDDAHCLSVFPNSPAFDSFDWVLGVPAPPHLTPHVPRATINPRLLEAAPVLVVTWGDRKADALGHVFGDVRDGRSWPVQRTRRPGAVWIIDEAAAASIPAALR
jgi:6-phosphogluconolactonase